MTRNAKKQEQRERLQQVLEALYLFFVQLANIDF